MTALFRQAALAALAKGSETDEPQASREDFLAALRQVPEPVTVVASDGPAGPGAITVSAFSSVSADPPTVLICLQSKGNAASAIIENARFTISFLSEGDREVAELCAGHGSSDHAARLALDGWVVDAAGLPHWGRAIAVLSCRLFETVEIGSHRVLVARVVEAGPGSEEAPLLYRARSYHALGDKRED